MVSVVIVLRLITLTFSKVASLVGVRATWITTTVWRTRMPLTMVTVLSWLFTLSLILRVSTRPSELTTTLATQSHCLLWRRSLIKILTLKIWAIYPFILIWALLPVSTVFLVSGIWVMVSITCTVQVNTLRSLRLVEIWLVEDLSGLFAGFILVPISTTVAGAPVLLLPTTSIIFEATGIPEVWLPLVMVVVCAIPWSWVISLLLVRLLMLVRRAILIFWSLITLIMWHIR